MSFRQTYKGIFQFKDQHVLERAMYETQSEASGADAMGLQECFRSEGVMLIDIDALAGEQDWEEMAVAMATLAMHASRGFLYAVAFDRIDGGKSTVEYYEASNGARKPRPENSATAPSLSEDFFPMVEGSTYNFAAKGLATDDVTLTVRKLEVNGVEYFYLENLSAGGTYYNEALDSAFFHKDKSQVFTVNAGNERELYAVDPDNPRSFQLVYNNLGHPGDALYAIWKAGDHFTVYTHEADTTLEVPAGRFEKVRKIRVEVYNVEEESMRSEVHYQYFAKGIGLVKHESEGLRLELKAYHVGA
jgi:hypothetical protein